MLPNFYYDQEQWLRAHQRGKSWSWSALRPQTVCGFALGSPMNLATGLALYAAISKELGLPLRFPGTEKAYRSLYQVTDSELLAECMHWCATSTAAANDVFNITNTDFFRWENILAGLRTRLDMEPGGVQTINLTEMMADKESLWNAMVERHNLQPAAYADLVSWPFVDYCLSRDYDVMSDH